MKKYARTAAFVVASAAILIVAYRHADGAVAIAMGAFALITALLGLPA